MILGLISMFNVEFRCCNMKRNSIEIPTMCYWDCTFCSCWWGYVLLNWGMTWSGWIVSMHGRKVWNMIVMRLSWDDDQMMLWWNVKIWILVKGQLSSSSLLIKFWWIWNESNPKKGGDSRMWKIMRRGLPQVKKRMGGDSRNWKEIMRRGLPQEKEMYMAGTPARKRNVCGGDSRKKRKRKEWAGTPAREKEIYMAGTPAIEWWYGGDSHKKRAGTPAMNGVANLISKHERGENWHHTV